MNTRYFSHYNKDYGVKKEQSNNEQALEYIQRHVEQLKMKQTAMALARGDDDPQDIVDDLKRDAKLRR